MKKLIVFALLLMISVASFGQPATETSMAKTDYLKKSKNQKTTAWVMLGGGAACILLGDLIGNSKESSFSDAGTGVIIAGAGVLSMLGSIPLFIASGRNKKRAMSMSFKNETVPLLQEGGFVNWSVPSLTLKITL